MNATAPVTEHIAAGIFESQRPFLSKNRMRVSVDMLSTATYPSITLITGGRRTAVEIYTTNILQESSKASSATSIPSQAVLNVFNSEYICGGTNLTLENYDAEAKNNRIDISI